MIYIINCGENNFLRVGYIYSDRVIFKIYVLKIGRRIFLRDLGYGLVFKVFILRVWGLERRFLEVI